MASSLRLVTSNLITRSFRPTVVSASHFLSRIAGHRSCTTIPIDADFFDQSWINNMCPKMSSQSFQMSMTDEDRSLFIDIPGGDGYVELKMSGVEKEDMKKKLPPIKEDMKLDGMLKVADLPHKDEFKTDIMANIMVNVIASFRDITTKRSWLYYDMFYDRSILGEEFCPVISSLSHISSFSINKLEDQGHESLSIKVSMPGDVKMKLTTQGLRVSLSMRRHNGSSYYRYAPEREDVKTYFDYDTLFIEQKKKNEHYITGIRLPEGIRKKNNMIKKEMKRGIFYAFIPCCVKKEDIKKLKSY